MDPTGAGIIWRELSATLRALRRAGGMSLRDVEKSSGIGRGTLSSVENAKAKPSRRLVEWYDEHFDGDGLLVAMFAEARSAHGTGRASRPVLPGCSGQDALRVDVIAPAAGELVAPGSEVAAHWRLKNLGSTSWSARTVRRVGVPAAPALITSDAVVALPDAEPGESVDLRLAVRMPDRDATLAAYWQVTHADERPCGAPGSVLQMLVTASSRA